MRKLKWGEVLGQEFSNLLIIFIAVLLLLLPSIGIASIIWGFSWRIVIGWIMPAVLVDLWGFYCVKNDNVKCVKCGIVKYVEEFPKRELEVLKCRTCASGRINWYLYGHQHNKW